MAGLNSFPHCSNFLTTGINVFPAGVMLVNDAPLLKQVPRLPPPDMEREHEQRHFSVHSRHLQETSAGGRRNARLPLPFRRPCCYIPAESEVQESSSVRGRSRYTLSRRRTCSGTAR